MLILALIITSAIIPLSKADDNTKQAEELIAIQEQFLSSIEPRPIGDKLKNSPLYPELVRRIKLTNKNWHHQYQGSKDAQKAGLALITLPNQSDVDIAYVKILKKELEIKVLNFPKGLDAEAQRFYAFGYNTIQLNRLIKNKGEPKLRDLLQKAAVQLGYRSTESRSLLFIPWRFKDFSPMTNGRK